MAGTAYRRLTIDDYTPSSAVPWLTLWDEDDEPHIVPGFGPKHELSSGCWCHPVLDGDYTQPAVSHNVAQ